METKHTPAPWKISEDGQGNPFITNPKEWGMICSITTREQNHEANAKLIASAPELLEALIKLNDYFFCEKPLEDDEYSDLIKITQNAINKAIK